MNLTSFWFLSRLFAFFINDCCNEGICVTQVIRCTKKPDDFIEAATKEFVTVNKDVGFMARLPLTSCIQRSQFPGDARRQAVCVTTLRHVGFSVAPYGQSADNKTE